MVVNINEFSVGYAKLCAAFNQEAKEAQMIVYYEHLDKIPYDKFMTAVYWIIKTNKFFPKVAELIEEIRAIPERPNLNNPALSSGEKMLSKEEVHKIIENIKQGIVEYE